MSSDPQTTAALGSIGTSLEHINAGMAEFRLNMNEARKEGDDRGREIHKRINDLSTDIGELRGGQTASKALLKAHVGDDNRRFALVWKVVFGGGSAGALVFGAFKAIGAI